MKTLVTLAVALLASELALFGLEIPRLACGDPYFAFDLSGAGYSPLDAMYIYDATNAEGRSLRITGGTSAFGAAKVSRLAETQIVADHFNGVHTFQDYSGHCKTGTLFNAYMPASMFTNRNETDVGMRIVKSQLASYGAGTGDVVEKLLKDEPGYLFNSIHSSLFWEMVSSPFPENDFVTPEKFVRQVPPQQFHNVLPYRELELIDPITYCDILDDPIVFSSCPNNMLEEFVGRLPVVTNEYGHDTSFWPDRYRRAAYASLSTNLTSILADRCKALSARDKYQRRFNYEKSCAEAWLISMFDTTFGHGRLELFAPYHSLTFALNTSWSFRDSVRARLSLNEEETEYRIVMDDGSLNFTPHPLEVTRDESPWDEYHGQIDEYTDVEREVVEVDVTCNGIIYLTQEEIIDGIAGHNLPDGQEFFIELSQDDIVRPRWRLHAIPADSEHSHLNFAPGIVTGIEGSDDWNVVLRLTVNGDGGYTGADAELFRGDYQYSNWEYMPRKFAWENDMIQAFCIYSIFLTEQEYGETEDPVYLGIGESAVADTLSGAEQLAAENHQYVLDFVNGKMEEQTGINLVERKINLPFSEHDLIQKLMDLSADPQGGLNSLAGLIPTNPYRFKLNNVTAAGDTEYTLYCNGNLVRKGDLIPCKIGYGVMHTMPIETDYVSIHGYDMPYLRTTYKFKSMRIDRN